MLSFRAFFITAMKMVRKGREVWTLSFLYTLGTLISSVVTFYFQKNPKGLLIVIPVLLLAEMVPWVGQLGVVICLNQAAQGQTSSMAEVNAGIRSFFCRWVFIRLLFDWLVLASSNRLFRSGIFPASMTSIKGILTNFGFDLGDSLLTILGLYILLSAMDGDQFLIPTAVQQGARHWIERFGTTIGLALFLALVQVLLGMLFQSDFMGRINTRLSVLFSYGWLFLSLPFITALILSAYYKGRREPASLPGPPTEDLAPSSKE